MKLFKKKPNIKIIAVTHETRDYEIQDATSYSYIGGGAKIHNETTKRSYTLVLCSVDGELISREFNGNWKISDIKKWEDL